jgi:hypothetical protein
MFDIDSISWVETHRHVIAPSRLAYGATGNRQFPIMSGPCHIAVSMHADSGHEWRDLIA